MNQGCVATQNPNGYCFTPTGPTCNPSGGNPLGNATATSTVTTTGSVTSTSTTTPSPGQECQSVEYSGNPSAKLNVVFLGDKYNDLSTFASDVNVHSSTLLNFDVFSSNKNRINIWRVDSLSDLGCYYNCGNIERLICCDQNKVFSEAAKCQKFDQVIVLVNNNEYGGSGELSSIVSTSDRGDPITTVHEFDHSFGKLYDEYLYGSTTEPSPPKGPNCDDNTCSSWNGLSQAQCIQGCEFNNWYRPSQCSIMSDLSCQYFNTPSEKQIQKLLSSFSPEVYSPQKIVSNNSQTNQKFYMLQFHYSNGSILLTNSTILPGIMPTLEYPTSQSYQIVAISQNTVPQIITFQPPTDVFYDYVENNQFKGGIAHRNDFDFIEFIPYIDNLTTIQLIHPNGTTIMTVDFSGLSSKNNTTINKQFSPSEIVNIVKDKNIVEIVDSVYVSNASKEKIEYTVIGEKNVTIAWFIHTTMTVEMQFDASSGNITQMSKPWWNFFVTN